MTAPQSRARALLFFWLGLAWLTFEAFLYFDWGKGRVRAALLLVIGALLWALGQWARELATVAPPSKRMSRLAVVLLVVGTLANVGPSTYFIYRSYATHTVLSDQAETVIDGLHVLEQGDNPYASSTVLDAIAHELALKELAAQRTCREPGASVRFRVGRAGPAVVPSVATNAECRRIVRMFASLGFKYGPVMLGFYWPFFAVFGHAGFLLSHVVLVLGLGTVLYRSAETTTGSTFWAAIALLPFLFPTELVWNVLAEEHLDILPVCLVALAWLAWRHDRFEAAAVCVGFSVAAKFLPGLLFLPLLLKARPRVWPIPIVIAALCFAPFAAWDWTGFTNNIGYPFTRPPDSTALVYFCSPTVRLLVRGLALSVIVAFAVRSYRRGWDKSSGLAYLIAAHLAVLASGTALHNNYLVWLLPLVSLHFAQQIEEAREPT